MTVFWVSFGLIAILIPVGIFTFIGWGAARMDPKPTKEQYARAGAKGFYYTFFYWLCDLFYMACFKNFLICKFIFGGLILAIILVSLSRSFSVPTNKTTFNRVGLVHDLVIGICLTIYLIYIIPNAGVKEIVIPVVAAVYGGLITLVGVAWTIKKSDRNRKEDEEKKARPIFSFEMIKAEPQPKDIKRVCFPTTLGTDYKCEVLVELENSPQSVFEIARIFHDGKWFDIQGNTKILPSTKCMLNFEFNNPLAIFLEVNDILLSKHYYEIKVLLWNIPYSNKKIFHTVREIKEISLDEMNKIIREGEKNE